MNIDTFVFAILFFFPAAVANASVSVLMRKTFLKNFLSIPVDLGSKYKGEYLIGKHKTYGGWLIGTLAAGLFAILIHYIVSNVEYFSQVFEVNLDFSQHFLLGLLLGFGAIGGDLFESALKRRVGIPQGKSWFPFDQIDFIVGALLASLLVTTLPLKVYLIILIKFFILHLIAKVVGYVLGVDKNYI